MFGGKKMRGKSIFGFICENLTEKGELNEEFRLPYDSDDSIGFMDGAKDGICIYHFGAENVTDEQISKMFQAVQLASENKTDEADEKFRDFANEYRMINVVNEFQTCIMEHKEELDPVNLYKYAIHLLLESDDRECVKAGMVILELLNIDDELKDVVRILGLSDEFTIFAIYVMKDWENSALEIFELAKKVHGWGRVHAVAYLEPVNDEIRHWLLTEGTDNDVLPAYSGLICFQKAEVEQELEKDVLSREIMHGILKIIDAMLDEGPVLGISQLEDLESVLNKILKHARQSMPLQVEDYEMIQNISMWAENQVVNPEIMRLAEAILCDERCLEAVKAEVKKGKHIRLAAKLGIDN
jgi:hypothetical protein